MSHVSEIPLLPVQAWSNVLAAKRARPKSTANFWGPVFASLVAMIWLGSIAYGLPMAVTLLAVMGFTGAILGYRWPVLGLFSVGLLAENDNLIRVFLADGSTIFKENSFNYLLFLTLLIFGLTIFKRKDPHTWFLIALIALLSLELYLSAGLMAGALHVLNGLAGFSFIIYFTRGMRDENALFWLAVMNGVGAAVGGAMYYLQKESLSEAHIDRNGLAYFFLTGIFTICLGFRAAANRRGGIMILGGLATLCGCWVFLTASRGGMLIGATAFLCLLAQIRGNTARFMIIGFGMLISIGVLIQFAEQLQHSSARVNKLLDDERSLASRTSGRSDLLKGGLKIFLANPLGVGTGGYAEAYKEVSRNAGEYTFAVDHAASAHSAWLKVLVENGFPGFLLLAGYVFSFVHVGWKKWNEGLFLLGLLATVALAISFISSEFQGKGLWFLAAGVTVLLHRKTPAPLPPPTKKSRRS